MHISNNKIMTPQQIKRALIRQIAEEFDASAYIDEQSLETQIVSFSTLVEYETYSREEQSNVWNDAQVCIECIRIYFTSEESTYETYGDIHGRGQYVGGEISVESVDYGDIEVYVNGAKAGFQILQKEIEQQFKNNQNA